LFYLLDLLALALELSQIVTSLGVQHGLAELVCRADAGETLFDTCQFLADTRRARRCFERRKSGSIRGNDLSSGDEPETKSAALLVLMATIENSTHPKVLANTAKHLAFTRCGEVATVERELFAKVV